MNFKEYQETTIVRRLMSSDDLKKSVNGNTDTRTWAWLYLTTHVPLAELLRVRFAVEVVVRCFLSKTSEFAAEAAAWVEAHVGEAMVLAVLFFEASRNRAAREQVCTKVYMEMYRGEWENRHNTIWRQILNAPDDTPIDWNTIANHFSVPRTYCHQPNDTHADAMFYAGWQLIEPTPADELPARIQEVLRMKDWFLMRRASYRLFKTLGYEFIDTSADVAPAIPQCLDAAIEVLRDAPLGDLLSFRLITLIEQLLPNLSPNQVVNIRDMVLEDVSKKEPTSLAAFIPYLIKTWPDETTIVALLERYKLFEYAYYEARAQRYRTRADNEYPPSITFVDKDDIIDELPIEFVWMFESDLKNYSNRWWQCSRRNEICQQPEILKKFGRKILKGFTEPGWGFLNDYLDQLPADEATNELTYWLATHAKAWIASYKEQWRCRFAYEEPYKWSPEKIPPAPALTQAKPILERCKALRVDADQLFDDVTARYFYELILPIADEHFESCDFCPLWNDTEDSHRLIPVDNSLFNRVARLAKNNELLAERLWQWSRKLQLGRRLAHYVECASKVRLDRLDYYIAFATFCMAGSGNQCYMAIREFLIIADQLRMYDDLPPNDRNTVRTLLRTHTKLEHEFSDEYREFLDDWFSPTELVDHFFETINQTDYHFPSAFESYIDWAFAQEDRERKRLNLDPTTTPLNIRVRIIRSLIIEKRKYNLGPDVLLAAARFIDDPRIYRMMLSALESGWKDKATTAAQILSASFVIPSTATT